MINTILEDKRPIKVICFDGGPDFRVGIGDITKIQVYPEAGEFCPIPHLAIFKGEQIFARTSALFVTIIYADI